MASIRNRGNKWQARVTHKGFPDEVKSFTTRQDAERWARSVETETDKGFFISRSAAESKTFKVVRNGLGEKDPLNRLAYVMGRSIDRLMPLMQDRRRRLHSRFDVFV